MPALERFAFSRTVGPMEPPEDVSYAKVHVFVLMMANVGLCLWFQFYGYKTPLFSLLPSWGAGCDTDACRSDEAVYRVASAAWAFFASMSALCVCRRDAHHACWCSKWLYWATLVLVSLALPATTFTGGFLDLARVGGYLFIVLQQILLVDAAYNWNDRVLYLASQACDEASIGDRESRGDLYLNGLLLISCTLLLVALGALGAMLYFFGGCSSSYEIITFSGFAVVAVTAYQLSDVESEGSLLTSSIVAVYAVYLGYSSVSANPVKSCNPMYSTSSDWIDIVLGLSFAFVSMAWVSFRAPSAVHAIFGVVHDAPSREALAAGSAAADDAAADDEALERALLTGDDEAVATLRLKKSARERDLAPRTPSFGWEVNFLMSLIALYIPMVLTDWGIAPSSSTTASSIEKGKAAMWIQFSAECLVYLLYFWSLIAPRLFPDRDFSTGP